MEFRKMLKTLYAEQKKRHRFIQHLDSVGEGEGGMFQENSIETCILSRVKQITSPGWMHETSKALRPGALGRPGGSGWRGRWEGGSGWGRHTLLSYENVLC